MKNRVGSCDGWGPRWRFGLFLASVVVAFTAAFAQAGTEAAASSPEECADGQATERTECDPAPSPVPPAGPICSLPEEDLACAAPSGLDWQVGPLDILEQLTGGRNAEPWSGQKRGAEFERYLYGEPSGLKAPPIDTPDGPWHPDNQKWQTELRLEDAKGHVERTVRPDEIEKGLKAAKRSGLPLTIITNEQGPGLSEDAWKLIRRYQEDGVDVRVKQASGPVGLRLQDAKSARDLGRFGNALLVLDVGADLVNGDPTGAACSLAGAAASEYCFTGAVGLSIWSGPGTVVAGFGAALVCGVAVEALCRRALESVESESATQPVQMTVPQPQTVPSQATSGSICNPAIASCSPPDSERDAKIAKEQKAREEQAAKDKAAKEQADKQRAEPKKDNSKASEGQKSTTPPAESVVGPFVELVRPIAQPFIDELTRAEEARRAAAAKEQADKQRAERDAKIAKEQKAREEQAAAAKRIAEEQRKRDVANKKAEEDQRKANEALRKQAQEQVAKGTAALVKFSNAAKQAISAAITKAASVVKSPTRSSHSTSKSSGRRR